VIAAGWLAAFVVAGLPLVLTNSRAAAVPPELRPQRFVVSPNGFLAPYEHDLRYARGPVLLAMAGFVGMAIAGRNYGPLISVTVLLVILARSHGPTAVTLTPAGVTFRPTVFAAPRTFAWGEPLEVPRNLAVNPWFVSATIRWYADHPDERPAIGTPAGHDRLREALRAEDPMLPPRPPLPRELVYATWLTYIGVVVGLLAGIRDVVLTTAFLPALKRAGSQPLLDDPDIILLTAVGGFVMALAAGALAVAMLHKVRRGRTEQARVTLVLLAAAAMLLWSPRPLDGYTLRYADIAHDTSVLIVSGWTAGHLFVSAIGLTTLLLLVSRPVQEFSRPPVSAGPYGIPVRR
jgi:hypothetical protein